LWENFLINGYITGENAIYSVFLTTPSVFNIPVGAWAEAALHVEVYDSSAYTAALQRQGEALGPDEEEELMLFLKKKV
jgi:hypothetical protein